MVYVIRLVRELISPPAAVPLSFGPHQRAAKGGRELGSDRLGVRRDTIACSRWKPEGVRLYA